MVIVAHRNTQFPQIHGTFSVKTSVHYSTQYKTYSLQNRQPVEFTLQCGSDMVIFLLTAKEIWILYQLLFRDRLGRKSSEESITLVQLAEYEGLQQESSGFFR